jgi:hypothetical protein
MTGTSGNAETPAGADGTGAVDSYLDEMFDQLAGTGAAGRRAVDEAQDHLRASVADEVARGVPPGEAEYRAVTRFGSPDRIASGIRRANRSVSWGSVMSGAWLLAGLAVLVLAATYLLKALDIAVLLRMHPEDLPPCADPEIVPVPGTAIAGACSSSVPALQENLAVGLAVLVIGVAVLAARWLATRRVGLAAPPRRFPVLAAALFAAGGLALLLVNPTSALGSRLYPQGLFGVEQGAGFWHEVIASGLALVTAVGAVIWYLARTLRRAGGA